MTTLDITLLILGAFIFGAGVGRIASLGRNRE